MNPRVTLLLALVASAARAQQPRQAKVLVLYGVSAMSASQFNATSVLRERLVEPAAGRVAMYEEFPDLAWMADPSQRLRANGPGAIASFRKYLELKYAGVAFDLVLTVGAPAFDFYRTAEPPAFPGVPVIACLVARDRIQQLPLDSLVSVVTDSIDLRGTIELALALQPETRRVVVVGGASAGDLAYVARMRAARSSFSDSLGFTFVVGKPLSEVEAIVSRLDRRSVVLYLSLNADSLGNQYDQTMVLDRLSAATAAPFYVWNSSSFGKGAVGGKLQPSDSAVALAAALALRAIDGEPFARLPRRILNPTVRVLDSRALARWQLDASRAPAGTVIAFRQESVWARYSRAITLALALILAQSTVIAALVIQRQRRRHAESRSEALLFELRESHDRIHRLAGRLITAQESERTRIGRELHDDINQKVAALAIGLSRVKRQLPAGAEETGRELGRLQARAVTLADEVRQISHQLHSSVLQHAGLSAALQSACRELFDQHEIQTTMAARGDVDEVSADVALCVYRVGQEALRNAARHARPKRVRIDLARDERAITLSVADDGNGFEPRALRSGSSLGLISLEERARLLKGTLDVESRPGHGTTITLTVPLGASAPTPAPHLEAHAAHHGTAR